MDLGRQKVGSPSRPTFEFGESSSCASSGHELSNKVGIGPDSNETLHLVNRPNKALTAELSLMEFSGSHDELSRDPRHPVEILQARDWVLQLKDGCRVVLPNFIHSS